MCLDSSPSSFHCPGAAVVAPTHCEGDTGSSALHSAGSPPMGGLLCPHCGCHGNTVCVQQCESTLHDGGIRTQRKHQNIVDHLQCSHENLWGHLSSLTVNRLDRFKLWVTTISMLLYWHSLWLQTSWSLVPNRPVFGSKLASLWFQTGKSLVPVFGSSLWFQTGKFLVPDRQVFGSKPGQSLVPDQQVFGSRPASLWFQTGQSLVPVSGSKLAQYLVPNRPVFGSRPASLWFQTGQSLVPNRPVFGSKLASLWFQTDKSLVPNRPVFGSKLAQSLVPNRLHVLMRYGLCMSDGRL